jgi:hypothetical protein
MLLLLWMATDYPAVSRAPVLLTLGPFCLTGSLIAQQAPSLHRCLTGNFHLLAGNR